MQYLKKVSLYLSGGHEKRPQLPSAAPIPSDDQIGSFWQKYYPSSAGPQYHIIAPGRVNIIGEHIDHQNYNVLPCAIDRSIHIYLSIEERTTESSKSQPLLEIRHASPKIFTTRKFNKCKDIKIDKSHHWTNYIVAAYIGMVELYVLDKNTVKMGNLPNLFEVITEEQLKKVPADSLIHKTVRMLVTGDLPMAAGLSSSSALVVCAAMCFNTKGTEDPAIIAAACASCERYVGTAGGGMDQAAICLCQQGEALHIGFNPLTHEPIRLPPQVRIVVANTCREAPKVKYAFKMYNKRVFELKTACLWLMQQSDAEAAQSMETSSILDLTLRDVLKEHVKLSEDQLLEKLETYIPNKTYSKQDMGNILGDERRKYLLNHRCGMEVWDKNTEFDLHKRVRHVLTEHARVNEFVKTCRSLEGESDTEVIQKGLRRLGELLNESGKSLKEDFEASCDEIEELCTIARESGALGSRLTGAGWGGCTLALVPEEKVSEFIEKVKTNYYVPLIKGEKKRSPPLEDLPATIDGICDVCFATTPACCARVISY